MSIPEYIKMAKLLLVMVGGSVEDECTFSSITFIQSDYRSSLQPGHLDDCLRMFCSKGMYKLASFPIGRVYDVWTAQKIRRSLGIAAITWVLNDVL